MCQNGRLDRNLNVEVHLMTQLAHSVLISIIVGLESNRSSFWIEVMGQLALLAMRETPLERIAPIIERVQQERIERNQKGPENFNNLSLEELLVGVVVPPSKVAPPHEEDDSDGFMPGLAPSPSASDVPVPEEDSEDEYTNPFRLCSRGNKVPSR